MEAFSLAQRRCSLFVVDVSLVVLQSGGYRLPCVCLSLCLAQSKGCRVYAPTGAHLPKISNKQVGKYGNVNGVIVDGEGGGMAQDGGTNGQENSVEEGNDGDEKGKDGTGGDEEGNDGDEQGNQGGEQVDGGDEQGDGRGERNSGGGTAGDARGSGYGGRSGGGSGSESHGDSAGNGVDGDNDDDDDDAQVNNTKCQEENQYHHVVHVYTENSNTAESTTVYSVLKNV